MSFKKLIESSFSDINIKRPLHSTLKPTIKTQNPQFLTFQSQKTYKTQLSLKKSSISTIN
ncbi:hypothetical protein THERMOT_712, partial [Bathymodiolus thermophilus thioautotrophic gill symbiont]